jgi:MFS family permease
MNGDALATDLPLRVAVGVKRKVELLIGGPARTRVVVMFACVLALESADLATVGAAGPQLQSALHISNTQLGLLATVSTLVGALATVPFGALADRVRRVDLLAGAILLWGVAMVAGAGAQDYLWLLLSRLGLGAITAAAGPSIASLIGDFFPAAERAKIYGYILSGELVGAGVGFVVSGSVAGLLSWRWAFAVLAVPASFLALLIWRALPEPARGGQSRLDPGARRIVGADEGAAAKRGRRARRRPQNRQHGVARRAVAEQQVRPVREQILREDPGRMRIGRAISYVLSIKTNRWLIAASAIGYFFFAGIRTFALLFVRGHFAVGQTSATLILFAAGAGALIGVLVSGRLADRLTRQGRLTARIVVPAVCYVIAAVTFLPTLLLTGVVVAIPLLIIAGAAASAANPPLDAARLDIMPSKLWGRAEGVRTLTRQATQAGAPLVFGLLADAFGGSAGASASSQRVPAATTLGLQDAFLIMLVPLALNGVALLGARRSYPRDIATALASEARRPANNAEPDRS